MSTSDSRRSSENQDLEAVSAHAAQAAPPMGAPETSKGRPLGIAGWMGALLDQLDESQTPRA